MRCDEIQERFIELLYDELGTPRASEELQAHVRSCPACASQLAEFKAVRNALRTWEDESPRQPVVVTIPAAKVIPLRPRWNLARIAQYGAIAAVLLLALMALANAEITWNNQGFGFRTHLISSSRTAGDASSYYTKAETREILKRALDESEIWMAKDTREKINSVLETLEREKDFDYQLISAKLLKAKSNN